MLVRAGGRAGGERGGRILGPFFFACRAASYRRIPSCCITQARNEKAETRTLRRWRQLLCDGRSYTEARGRACAVTQMSAQARRWPPSALLASIILPPAAAGAAGVATATAAAEHHMPLVWESSEFAHAEEQGARQDMPCQTRIAVINPARETDCRTRSIARSWKTLSPDAHICCRAGWLAGASPVDDGCAAPSLAGGRTALHRFRSAARERGVRSKRARECDLA